MKTYRDGKTYAASKIWDELDKRVTKLQKLERSYYKKSQSSKKDEDSKYYSRLSDDCNLAYIELVLAQNKIIQMFPEIQD